MAELAHDQIVVELWPSLAEIQTSKMNNAYKGRLTEFYESVESLVQTLSSRNMGVESFTDSQLEKGEPAARALPPEIVELAAWLGSSGVALALYKALKLWVDSRNGRRIKIVDGSLEVEATQLTQEQFLELLDTLRQRKETLAETSEVQETLVKKGLLPVSVDSTERLEQRRALKNAALADRGDA